MTRKAIERKLTKLVAKAPSTSLQKLATDLTTIAAECTALDAELATKLSGLAAEINAK